MADWPRRGWRWLRASPTRGVLALTLVAWVACYFQLAKPEHKEHASFLSRADGTWMYLQLRSHVLDRDVDYRNDYAVVGTFRGRPKWDLWLGHTDRGAPHNPWTLGTGVMLAPFFVLGHGLVLLANLFGARISTFGTSLLHQYTTFLGSVLYAFWGLVLVQRFCARRFGETPSLVGCIGVALVSPLFYYSTFCPSYSHAVSFFCAAALMHVWDRHLRVGDLRRERTDNPAQLQLDFDAHKTPRPPRAWAWLGFGALVGLSALVRPQLVFFAIPGALAGLHWAWRLRGQGGAIGRLVLFGLGAVACAVLVFGPQMLYWKAMYGGYLVVPQGSWFMQWNASFLWESLFSARAGLLVVTPVLWFAALGLLLMARRYPADAALLTGLVLLTAWANGAAWDFWGGGTFSARRMTCAVAPLMVGGAGLIAVARDLGRRRARLVGWVTAGLLVMPLALFSFWHMREVATTPAQSSHHPDRDMARYWKEFLQDSQDSVGNPLTYPHALWIRARHGVPLSAYSRLTTDFPLEWPPRWVTRNHYSSQRRRMDLTSHRWRKLLAGGAIPVTIGKNVQAWGVGQRCVRLYLPLRARFPYGIRFEFLAPFKGSTQPAAAPLTGRISLSINGRSLGDRDWTPPRRPAKGLPGVLGHWESWAVPPQRVRPGINLLRLCGPPGRIVLRRFTLSYRR